MSQLSIVLLMGFMIGCASRKAPGSAATQPASLPETWLRSVEESDGTSQEIYFVPDDQLKSMPRISATVSDTLPCCVYFTTADGRTLCIGGPFSQFGSLDFMKTFKKGQNYSLPDEFLAIFAEHQRQER